MEKETDVDQRRGDRFAVDHEMSFDEVQAARPDDQRRRSLVEPIGFPALGIVPVDRASHGVAQIRLAGEHVRPRRRGGILEIRHEDVGARVESVDHHLAVSRPRDLDDASLQISWSRRNTPVARANRRGAGEEIESFFTARDPRRGAGLESSAKPLSSH